jgi:hypothetical protein
LKGKRTARSDVQFISRSKESRFVLEDELAIAIGVSKRLNDLAKILEQSPLLE